MTTSKVIVSDDLTAYERWELPLVNGEAESSSNATAKELETIQQQAAYEEGFARGQKEGHEQKAEELQQKLATLHSIIELLSEPLKEIDDEIIDQLSHLSMAVARQVIRRELHAEEGEIVGIVREAMSALPASSRKIILKIHPDDSELIRSAFSLSEVDETDEQRWKVVEDPMISRGGCKISSENSTIDATVEARLNRVITTLMGGERESDE